MLQTLLKTDEEKKTCSSISQKLFIYVAVLLVPTD